MKVKELIEKLQAMPDNLTVYIPDQEETFKTVVFCEVFDLQHSDTDEIVCCVISTENIEV